ncbi:MAG: ABC transporter substrate-binding protein [Rhodospirillaceae bacterium]
MNPILRLLALSVSFVAAVWAIRPEPVAADEKPFTILMVQWRGHTATDDGFRDFFAADNIPVRIVLRDADRRKSQVTKIIDEIKATRPDLVYAWGLAAASTIIGTPEQVREHPELYVTDIPVVACTVADPVAAGLSTSWETSSRNFTGVSHVPPMLAQVKAMKMYDTIKTLAVIYNPMERSPVAAVEELRLLAPQQGFRLSEYPVPLDAATGKPRADALPGLIAEIAAQKPTFLYLGPDSFLAVNNHLVVEEANRLGLPTFGASEVFVRDSPGLAGLVSRYYNVGRYCGYKASEILVNKKRASDIPFDTLKRFSYIVNKSSAKMLKYYPPLEIVSFIEVVN